MKLFFLHLRPLILSHYFASGLIGILYLAVHAVVIALIVYFIIFKNDGLARKMAGAGEEPDPTTQTIWLITSLRLGSAFYGLVLLSSSIAIVVTILCLLWPPNIRVFITNIITSPNPAGALDLSGREWFTNGYKLIKAILAIYLLCGAPHFVRWQLNHSITGNQPKTPKNSNSHNISSERADNE